MSPESTGQAQAVVTDSPEEGPSAALAPAGDAGPRQATTSGSYEGTLTADAQVSISADGETWIDLGSPRSVSLALQSTGDSTSVHGTVDVPVGTYAYVRLELDGAGTHINAGGTIGGISLTAAVDITLGTNGRVVIEKQVEPFTIQADGRTTIVFDMNSEAWVTEENADDKQVEEQEVEDSCETRTRHEPEPYQQ